MTRAVHMPPDAAGIRTRGRRVVTLLRCHEERLTEVGLGMVAPDDWRDALGLAGALEARAIALALAARFIGGLEDEPRLARALDSERAAWHALKYGSQGEAEADGDEAEVLEELIDEVEP